MSSDRGRSWRPEKKVTARQSRRKQISVLSALLIGLAGAVGWLIFRPQVPTAHFVLVWEETFSADDTTITPLPPDSTAVNAERLLKAATRLHELDSSKVNEPEKRVSVSALVDTPPDAENKLLVVYVTTEATIAPLDTDDSKICVQLLSADAGKKPIPFKKLLTSLRQSGAKRTLLLLELTGRHPGFASGVLADDLPSLLKSELRAENVPGLTFICACNQGERSWEFFHDKLPSTTAPSKAPETGTPVATAATLPEFDGTVFGHFLISALEEGEAENAATLYRYLEQKVKGWVEKHYNKSSQTVWMVSSDDQSPQGKLLSGIKLPKVQSDAKSGKEAEVTASESKPQQGNESVAATPDGTPASGTAPSAIDDRPSTLLQLKVKDRDALAEGTTPVQFPGEWLRFQMHLMAAERFAMNGRKDEFNRIHDKVLNESLKRMKGPAGTKTPTGQDTIREWLLLSQVPDGIGVQFGPLLNDFGVEAGKAPPLPKELQSPGPDRRSFAIELVKELSSLRQAIDAMPQADRIKRIQQLARLLENITDKGWRLNQFPESMATVKEVLQTWEQDPDALRLKPLVQLLALRQSALQLAAGYGSDNLRLRQATWDDYDLTNGLNEILIRLNSAERWLCAGPDAVALANNQMDVAEKALGRLRKEVDESQKLSQVQDAQRLELPFLIEYLALRQESTSLPDKELKAACRMAESAVAGTLDLDEFPTGQLEPIGFSRDHLAAMFELTRVFSSDNRVSSDDERHLNLLREYINIRSRQTISATERSQLLNVPQFSERANLLNQLQSQPTVGIEDKPDPSSHSGIWLSFWSLRLADAISGQLQDTDWEKWKALVSAIDQGKVSDVPMLQNEMAITLQKRWKAMIEKLQAHDAEDVFVSEKDVLDLLSREASRRAQTSRNEELYGSILQTTKAVESAPSATKVEAPSEVTPLADGSYEVSLKVQNVSAVYLLDKDFNVLNKSESHHNWSVISVSPVSGTENAVILRLQPKSILASPVPVNLIFVNPDGAAVESHEIVVQPSAANEWSIQVVRVKEEKDTTEQTVDTPPGKSHSDFKLPLPPSTLDMPVLLKVRLRRDKGVASKVRVQIRPVHRQRAAWADMELSFPPGESEVIVPMVAPPSVGDASAAAPTAAAPEIDITEGVLFEITPLNLNEEVTSRLTLYPSLLLADDIFSTPFPVYDHRAQKLTLRLDQQDFNNSSRIWPTQFPGELVLNPALAKFQKPGGALKTPNTSTFEFLMHFQPEIENAIGRVPLEFGISLAGIPHAWWWRLNETTEPKPITNEIRAFLHVENEQEVKVIPEEPELLIGEGSRKASIRSEIFLHGIQFDQEQQLNVRISSAGSDGSMPATDRPISVNRRFAESVTVTPGAVGVWKVTTKTSPYKIPGFTPESFRLAEGRHKLIASLSTNDPSAKLKESSVFFTLDESPPILNENSIVIEQSPVLVTGSLKGKITVTDPESGVARIRVGLKEESMQELKVEPDTKIIEDFELNALDFPKLEQKESDNTESGTLTVEVTNGVGLSTKKTKRIAFVRRGKAIAMKEEPKKPGIIKVTFGIEAILIVSVTGTGGYKAEQPGMSPVEFKDVPAGKYSVTWKPKQGTSPKGGKSGVIVRSNETTSVEVK